MKKENKYMIMLGMFSKNTPEHANNKKEKVATVIDEVNIIEGDYLTVNAGPFDKAKAEENLTKLIKNGFEGYIYPCSEKAELTEEKKEHEKDDQAIE